MLATRYKTLSWVGSPLRKRNRTVRTRDGQEARQEDGEPHDEPNGVDHDDVVQDEHDGTLAQLFSRAPGARGRTRPRVEYDRAIRNREGRDRSGRKRNRT